MITNEDEGTTIMLTDRCVPRDEAAETTLQKETRGRRIIGNIEIENLIPVLLFMEGKARWNLHADPVEIQQ